LGGVKKADVRKMSIWLLSKRFALA